MKVKCHTKNKDVQDFGNCTGDLDDLTIGETYNVEDKKVSGWHTKIWLEGIKGSFNDQLFDEINKEVKDE